MKSAVRAASRVAAFDASEFVTTSPFRGGRWFVAGLRAAPGPAVELLALARLRRLVDDRVADPGRIDGIGLEAEAGQDGVDGADGLNCWDLNGNGVADPEEDTNGDSVVSALDCQGEDGVDGSDGADGQDGTDGANGLNCWDLNGNGIADPAEDIDSDGFFTAMDCRGADGLNCWDLNSNGTPDLAEDTNGDGIVSVLDCRGSDGGSGAVDSAEFQRVVHGSRTAKGMPNWTGVLSEEYLHAIYKYLDGRGAGRIAAGRPTPQG